MSAGIDAVEVPIRGFPDGWRGRLQPLGNRLRSRRIIDDSGFGDGVGDAIRRHLDDALIVWTVGRAHESSSASSFWAAVCRKILDRSPAPLVPPEFEAQFDDSPTDASPVEIIAAAFFSEVGIHRWSFTRRGSARSGSRRPSASRTPSLG